MKRFNHWLNTMSRPETADALAALHAMRPWHPYNADGESFGFVYPARSVMRAARPQTVPPASWDYWLTAFQEYADAHNMLQIWTLAGFLSEGVKIYVPTAEEYEAFSKVEIRLPWKDFRLPFDSFGMVIPEELYTAPLTTEHEIPGVKRIQFGLPVALVARIDLPHEVLTMEVFGTGEKGSPLSPSLVTQIPIVATDERSTEDVLERWGQVHAEPLQDTDSSEKVFNGQAVRAFMNACLLMTCPDTMRKLGAANPDYYSRLTRNKKNLPPSVRAANLRAARLHPVIYGFHQHIKLVEYARSEPDHDAPGSVGSELRPHWRKGHWRKQHYGPRVENATKRIFVPPVFVNRHLLAGPMTATRVTVTG